VEQQSVKDEAFKKQLEALIEALGGTETCSHILILENKELFDYVTYNEATEDKTAWKIEEKRKK